MAEGLSVMTDKATSLGFFNNLNVSNNGLVISHVQFDDDTILFCKAEED